jgi:glutamate/aspartate transport system substrate-binding protein
MSLHRSILVVVFILLAGVQEIYSQTLERIQKTKTLSIGHRESAIPISFIDSEGPKGYAVDICRAIAKQLQTTVRIPKIELRYVKVDGTSRFEKIQNGEIDLECGTTTNTLSRQQRANFSYTILQIASRAVIRQDSKAADWQDLAANRVGVLRNSTTEKALRTQ